MFIKNYSEEIPESALNAKQAMNVCMSYLWENVIEPSTDQGIIGQEDCEMIKKVGDTLKIIATKAYAYEKMLDNNEQFPYNPN